MSRVIAMVVLVVFTLGVLPAASRETTAINARLSRLDVAQRIESGVRTAVEWTAGSPFFDPLPAGLWTPDRPTEATLTHPGIWTVTFVVTFSPDPTGLRKAHLELWDGRQWTNDGAFDGGEVAATQTGETTVNGAGFIRSTGSTRIRLLAEQRSGRPLWLSESEYETHLHVDWRR